MASIRKSLLQFAFAGAFMKRWNDKLRPVELLEIDKQGHKMIVAWTLYMLNSRDLEPERRSELAEAVIEGGIFEYFYRLVITDIKPPRVLPDQGQSRALPAPHRVGAGAARSQSAVSGQTLLGPPLRLLRGNSSVDRNPATGAADSGSRSPLCIELGVQPHQGREPAGRRVPGDRGVICGRPGQVQGSGRSGGS